MIRACQLQLRPDSTARPGAEAVTGLHNEAGSGEHPQARESLRAYRLPAQSQGGRTGAAGSDGAGRPVR